MSVVFAEGVHNPGQSYTISSKGEGGWKYLRFTNRERQRVAHTQATEVSTLPSIILFLWCAHRDPTLYRNIYIYITATSVKTQGLGNVKGLDS